MDDLDLNALVPDIEEKITFNEAINQPDGPWLFNCKPLEAIPEGHETFVYLITNKVTKKRYVGFKTTVSKRTKIVKRKKKHVKIESDWKSYWSSSENLVTDLTKYGKSNFLREVIAFTVNKSVGRYVELSEQLNRKALTDNAELYYNNIVDVRLNGRTLQKINQVIYCDKLLGDELCKN